jgi:hypothetical protein
MPMPSPNDSGTAQKINIRSRDILVNRSTGGVSIVILCFLDVDEGEFL